MPGKRLLLINPVNPVRTGLAVNKSSRFPPIGLGIVAGLTPENWEVELVDENWTPFTHRKADLVGITAFTASANRAYQIAATYKEQGVPVIIGGIHASMRPEEAGRFVDAVVIGEAETVWPRVMADVDAGRLQSVYKGEWSALNDLAVPRRDLFHPDYMFASVQTSRGCPMDCEFCSVTAFNGRRYRRRPPREVLDELESLSHHKMLFFVDDNIIGYGKESKEQALEIFRGMVERKMKFWWFCQASLNFGEDDEVLYWAGRSGCKMVFLGLEAEEVDGLAEVNKQLNLSRGVDAYAEAFKRIHRAGISVLGAFIFGMDSDTPEKLERRAEYMMKSGVDVMQTTFLTPLPGTRLFDRLRDDRRLLYSDFPGDWDRYDMTEVVYRPGRMEPAVLSRTMAECNRRMYARPRLLRKAFRTICATRNPIAAMFAWNSNINYRNVALAQTESWQDPHIS
ncbi:MAG: B12-binding domain-containing radical SAM protein [Proteobacteria bacterium]|nr:B12-binding domain-containing radical SAM protein [Pseudomonadota bacterium]